jgi:predicted nucleic acid-binding Zn ribbon protein
MMVFGSYETQSDALIAKEEFRKHGYFLHIEEREGMYDVIVPDEFCLKDGEPIRAGDVVYWNGCDELESKNLKSFINVPLTVTKVMRSQRFGVIVECENLSGESVTFHRTHCKHFNHTGWSKKDVRWQRFKLKWERKREQRNKTLLCIGLTVLVMAVIACAVWLAASGVSWIAAKFIAADIGGRIFAAMYWIFGIPMLICGVCGILERDSGTGWLGCIAGLVVCAFGFICLLW